MSKEWMSKKITGNRDDWKETQGQTVNMVARPSQERDEERRA
jgi:hypothetical protein